MDYFIFELLFATSIVTIFLLAMFPIVVSPIGLGGILILVSFCLVSMIAQVSSGWYSYILFLVYIGGLLVLFIYVCMVSSNFYLNVSAGVVFYLSIGLLVLSVLGNSCSSRVLLFSGYESSGVFPTFLFLGLVVLLLAVFLAVVRIIMSGGTLYIEVNKKI